MKFGFPPLVLGGLALWIGWTWLAAFFFLLTAFVFYFFRDPERPLPSSPTAVVSPADGKVLSVVEEPFEGAPGRRIAIFLSVLDVHVNRAPVKACMASVDYRPGKFHGALFERASVENEQNVIRFESERGPVIVKQIAGWIARRILVWRPVGSTLERGERFGMIRFGSRVEIWLPSQARVTIQPGQRVRSGGSTIADWR
ncbi:MAG TPA: phosphatidylserine decarboxylase [Candidatus Dormibacteraeota bacterium]|nr:phosphatidylserine decarboxylase [Candidatus Dormibacteraeota bacterium]